MWFAIYSLVTFSPDKSSGSGEPVLMRCHGFGLKFFLLKGLYFCCMWQILCFFFFIHSPFFSTCKVCVFILYEQWMYTCGFLSHESAVVVHVGQQGIQLFQQLAHLCGCLFLGERLSAFFFNCCVHSSACRLLWQADLQCFFAVHYMYLWSIQLACSVINWVNYVHRFIGGYFCTHLFLLLLKCRLSVCVCVHPAKWKFFLTWNRAPFVSSLSLLPATAAL